MTGIALIPVKLFVMKEGMCVLKIKVFLYRAKQTLRAPNVEAVRNSNRYMKVVILSAPLTGRLYPHELKLVLIAFRS